MISVIVLDVAEIKLQRVRAGLVEGLHLGGGVADVRVGKQRYPMLFGVFGLRALACLGF